MNSRQKKLLESWIVLGVLLVVLIAFQDSDWNIQWAFLPIVIYIILNSATFSNWALLNKRFVEAHLQNRKVRLWVIASSSLLIVVAFVILASGFNPLSYLGIGSLFLLVGIPILPVIVLSQLSLYKELGK